MNAKLPSILLFVLLLMMLPSIHVPAMEQDWSQQFQQQVQHWISDLAAKDKQFKTWQDAKPTVQALGPGSHQWLITLSAKGKNVGYLVVAEAPESKGNLAKFVLLEYGLGEFILFDDAFAPQNIAAEPVYDGFSSYWRVAQHGGDLYVNAKTGERYPAALTPDPSVVNTLSLQEVINPGQQLTASTTLEENETDPFDDISWIGAGPLRTEGEGDKPWMKLMQAGDAPSHPVVVSASLFHDEVMAPYSVGTIHVWSDRLAYIGVWDEGLRFLPYSYVNRVGKIIIPPEQQKGVS
ncbi:hypothetical protein ACI7RC_13175 [Brevibacillus sp. B_LB10_24]|uniref:hypothetical protein n=1 Tax=Brevibacillus sp. B_LB10_24 TaxID=3380645 RepID=UPI0038BCDBB9